MFEYGLMINMPVIFSLNRVGLKGEIFMNRNLMEEKNTLLKQGIKHNEVISKESRFRIRSSGSASYDIWITQTK